MLHRDATFKKHVVMISFSILSCMKKIFNIKIFSATKLSCIKEILCDVIFFSERTIKIVRHKKNFTSKK